MTDRLQRLRYFAQSEGDVDLGWLLKEYDALVKLTAVGSSWLPTIENVNALPLPIRKYIHDLETNVDPAGTVRELSVARDMLKALEARITELKQERNQ